VIPDDEWGVALAAPIELRELASEHGGTLDDGLSRRVVRRLVPADHAHREDDLAVVTSPRFTAIASASPAVLLCQTDIASRCPAGRRWVHAHAMYVVAKLMGSDVAASGVHPEARVDPRAVVDPSATVGARAAILAGARIGPQSVVGDGAIVHGGVRIGARVVIGPFAVIGRPGFGWATGPNGDVVRVPQRGGVVIEDDVEVGALATVDAGTLGPTILERGVKLDSHVHVGHNVSVGEHTYVAAQSGFAGSARIGRRVLVGGQVGVTDHAVVGEGARIAAKSGVIGDVAPGAVVAGFPAVPKALWLRAWAKLLGRHKVET
jgi:UDP-3-O-[3-hydroxymyristoyl] glucosamine N-acyltransferase